MEGFYLGDGLYADADELGSIKLTAPRDGGTHYVVLDSTVLLSFGDWLRHRQPELCEMLKTALAGQPQITSADSEAAITSFEDAWAEFVRLTGVDTLPQQEQDALKTSFTAGALRLAGAIALGSMTAPQVVEEANEANVQMKQRRQLERN